MTGSDGWTESAAAWVREIGSEGDFSRRCVLDRPMLEQIAGHGFETALDVGCGEGRFCRMVQALGIRTVGIDPTEALLERARASDPGGEYRLGRAEALGVAAGSFDLVVSYLTLIDIPDAAAGIAEMTAALRPGGTLLIANLLSFVTAANPDGWTRDATGAPILAIRDYLGEQAVWVAWEGIRIQNWHRPLATYMRLLLGQGLVLRHFAEPEATGDAETVARYRRAPYLYLMAWRKPL